MRWMVSAWQLVFTAAFVALLGLMAGTARAEGGGLRIDGGAVAWSYSFGYAGTQSHVRHRHGWHHPHDRLRDKARRKHRRWHRRHGFPHGPVIYVDPWYQPWPRPPRTVVIERPVPVPAPAPSRATAPPVTYCREFQKQIIIDGRPERAFGIVCRQPDGTWKLQP